MPDLNDSSLNSPTAAAVTAAPTPAAQPQAAPGRTRRWLLWGAAILIGLPALLTALLTWWLPDWARPRIEAAATEALGTPVQLGRIELTPWQLDLRLHDLQVGPAGAPLARLASAHVQFAAESLWRGAPVLRRIELVGPGLWLHREAPERYNFSAVLAHLQARQAQAPKTADTAPARFALHNITLQGGHIHLQDDVLGQRHDIEALQIGLPFLSNLPSDVTTEVQPQLQAQVDGSALQLKAQARPFAPGQPAQLQLDWRALALQPWLGLVKPLLPAELTPQLAAGTLDAALSVDFEGTAGTSATTPAPRLLVRGNVTLNGLDLALPGLGAQARWNKLQLRELTLAPLTQDYRIAAIELDGLDARYTRQAASAARPAPPSATSAATAATPPASAASGPTAAATPPPLHWQIGALQCRACRVQLHDTLVQPATRITLQDIQLNLHELDSDPARPILFTLAAGLASAVGDQTATPPGTLQLKGQLQRSPLAAQADVQLGAIDLQVLQPYLAPHVNLVLVAGRLGTRGQLQLSQPAHAAQPDVQYAGQLDLAQLRSRDRLTGDEFVRWQQLGFDGLKLGWQTGALHADLGQVRLRGLDARVILHPDGHVNLADVVRRTEQPQTSLTTPQTGAAQAPQAAASARTTVPKAELPDLRWQAIRIDSSELRFSDHFIQPNYSARLTRLQGSVSALSAQSPAPARVELAGALDDGAPLHIAGQLHPLGPQLYTDIEAGARGIALPRLSTYAERYAGYGIEKGSLSVTLHYRIEQGKLQAEHQLVLDQLTFGAPVERPGITQLPVRLAAALLQDRHGVIDLQLPVAGTLDDPQFSVGAILWKVLVNLVSKAVTAPFALLMGNDGEAAGQIDFAPGSAELDAAARTRLDSLAERLADRPGVRVEATGQADLRSDAEALQHQQAALIAAQATTPAKASATTGTRQPASAAAAAPAASGAAPITEDALRALADERATQVMAYLTRRLPAERILLNRSTLLPDGAPHVQLKLH